MSTPQLILAVAIITFGVAVIAWLVHFMNRAVYGPVGATRSWHVTVPHNGANRIAYNCWTMAIEILDDSGAQLVQEWGSHGEVGDRTNREYTLHGTTVLLELDRWNGFTISGDRELLKPVADWIETHRKSDNNGLDAEASKASF